MLRVSSTARLISTKEAAELLAVSPRTITNWINDEKVPYVRLPGGEYRLPLGALLECLSGNYDLLPAIAALDEKAAEGEPRDES
jgi:excisionase family DNA binding protein